MTYADKSKQPSDKELMDKVWDDLLRSYFRQAPQSEVRRMADAPRQ